MPDVCEKGEVLPQLRRIPKVDPLSHTGYNGWMGL